MSYYMEENHEISILLLCHSHPFKGRIGFLFVDFKIKFERHSTIKTSFRNEINFFLKANHIGHPSNH